MLSRIARSIYRVGRDIERAQNVIRILEVNHKMHLERESLEGANIWIAIAEAFGAQAAEASEAALYGELVLSPVHEYSVRRCIAEAREHARATRDHLSEEMWLHLNRYFLGLGTLSFDEILRLGRSEFNQQVETFCDAFYGLAENTMMHGPSWHFLRIGRFLERASMICRILDVKRKALSLVPEHEGRPLDVHQWQALLRSLSGYEPYRRAYDARILPERVLEFALQNRDFPRSLRHALLGLSASLEAAAAGSPTQAELRESVEELAADLRHLDLHGLLEGGLEAYVRLLSQQIRGISEQLDGAFFSSLRPAPLPFSSAPGAHLVPQ